MADDEHCIDPAIRRELAGIEMAVAMAVAAFDAAVALDPRRSVADISGTLDAKPETVVGMEVNLIRAQLGAANATLRGMRLRLTARLAASSLRRSEGITISADAVASGPVPAQLPPALAAKNRDVHG
jgi:hypothetical protein